MRLDYDCRGLDIIPLHPSWCGCHASLSTKSVNRCCSHNLQMIPRQEVKVQKTSSIQCVVSSLRGSGLISWLHPLRNSSWQPSTVSGYGWRERVVCVILSLPLPLSQDQCLKESFIKAEGSGLTYGLQRLEYTPHPDWPPPTGVRHHTHSIISSTDTYLPIGMLCRVSAGS